MRPSTPRSAIGPCTYGCVRRHASSMSFHASCVFFNDAAPGADVRTSAAAAKSLHRATRS
jgi:hypothetical protein